MSERFFDNADMTANPFSCQRPASPDLFSELLGCHDPEQVAQQLTSGAKDPPSYWISGELKAGKTSFLLKLESLLAHQLSVEGNRWLTLPLYLSCEGCSGLQDVYRRILDRIDELFGDQGTVLDPLSKPITLSTRDCRLMSPSARRLQAVELLDHIRHDFGKILGQLPPERGRLVLLVDDPEAVVDEPWSSQLFLHLRSLLTQQRPEFRPTQCALVISGREDLTENDAFSRLLDVLTYREHIGPLSPSGLRQLILKSHTGLGTPRQANRILRATGGHPWLVQYLTDSFIGHCQSDVADFEQQFERIIGRRFQQDANRTAVLLEWLQRFEPPSKDVINALAIAPEGAELGMLVGMLAETLELGAPQIQKVLEKLRRMGLVYSLPGVGITGERLGLAEIFKLWFLEYTGGKVLSREVERLRRATTSESGDLESSGEIGLGHRHEPAGEIGEAATVPRAFRPPFSLFVSKRHSLVLADGNHVTVSDIDRDFSRQLSRLERQTRKCEELQDLVDLRDDLDDKFSRPSQWIGVWQDYVRSQSYDDNPLFVFRVTEPELLDFPVELIDFNDRFLGLEVPVIKEFVGLEASHDPRRNPAYRLREGLFPRSEPINVLLVASGQGGELPDGSTLGLLPLAEQEVTEIAEIFCAADQGGPIRIGQVVVMTTEPLNEAHGGERRKLTLEGFADALQGKLGINFDLVHFSGHSLSSESGDERSAGLLFPGEDEDGTLTLYNLARLRDDLQRQGSRVSMVYLSSCVSAQHDSQALLYLGAAHTCLAAGVPVVIGMRWPIEDGDARLLATEFYGAFIRNGIPEQALLAARKKAHQSECISEIAWAAPVMLCR